jgi:hypothetical protein
MKKIIGVLSLAVMMLTLSSCEVETSQNGDLDGFWHLEQVDTLATGGAFPCCYDAHSKLM